MRHNGVVESDIGDCRLTIDIVAVRAGVVAFESARHAERGGLHAQRIEDLLLHSGIISRSKFPIWEDEMCANISCGCGHEVAVLEDLTVLAGRLHGSEQRERRFRRGVLEFKDPLQVLTRQASAGADQVLHKNALRGIGVSQFETWISFGYGLVPAELP